MRTPEQLVRMIRREERRQTVQRLHSALRRGLLVQQLANRVGSQAEAGRLLGTSRQAVNKAIAAGAEPEFDALDAGEAPLTYLLNGWESYGTDILTVEEWEQLSGEEARQAAVQAAEAWEALAQFGEGMQLDLFGMRERLSDLKDMSEDRICEEYEPAALQRRPPDALFPHLVPRTPGRAALLSQLAYGLADTLSQVAETAYQERDAWRKRAAKNA